MGLDTSHGCWNGSYGAFMRWRTDLAASMDIPLEVMEGFGPSFVTMSEVTDEGCESLLHGKWCANSGWLRHLYRATSRVKQAPWQIDPAITILLSHSDCSGRIRWWDAGKIAIALGQFLRSGRGQALKHTAARNPEVQRADYDGTYAATKRFALGCAKAYRLREDVYFR